MSLFGGADADYWEPIRRRLIPPLHGVLRKYGGYAEHPVQEREYTCTIRIGEEEFEEVMDDEWDFSRNPVAALKHRPSDEAHEIGSFRRCYEEKADGSIVDGNMMSKWQLHIRVFPHQCGPSCEHDEPASEFVDLYTHWELNWLYDPFAHYNGKGWSPKEGRKRTMEFVEDQFDDDQYFDRSSD